MKPEKQIVPIFEILNAKKGRVLKLRAIKLYQALKSSVKSYQIGKKYKKPTTVPKVFTNGLNKLKKFKESCSASGKRES